MKISIITACRNSEKTLKSTLDSVLAQRDALIDYHVVDGGSTDGTVSIIKSYESKYREKGIAFTWTSEPDAGLYDAINKGIARATGDVIGILNADDVFDGDHVLASVAAKWEETAARTNDLQCLFGNVRFVRELGARTCRVCFARWWKPWMLQWGYMPPHPAIFIRRDCFEKWGMYVPSREEYRIAADYELLIRFFRVNRMKARYMKACITQMLIGGVSTQDVAARKRLNAEIIKGNRVNGYFCCWPMLLPKYLVKVWEVILPRLGLCWHSQKSNINKEKKYVSNH